MRKFRNFLDSYLSYADDGFVPPQFNVWSGLSIIAGALERKVWLPWNDTFSYYPNIYVLLVSMPGDGKSVALNKAVDLLMEVNRKTSQLNVMPNQVTEAKFIELMGHGRSFTERNGERELIHRQNAGYYWASEASNSLKNVFGDFIACLTDFYDCPRTWERATKKDGKKIVLTNVCMNLLAGSTFDYLGKLVNDENIMGGFASRLIYVVSSNKKVVEQQFQLGGLDPIEGEERRQYREALAHDLMEISKLVGPISASPEFGHAWEAWYPENERKRRAVQSEKAQSIMARTNTNVLKVAMLLCAAESNDRVMKIQHWERALELVSKIQTETPAVFRQAKATGSARDNRSVTSAVIYQVERSPGISLEQLKARLKHGGFSANVVDTTVQAMLTSGIIGTGNAVAGGGVSVKLLGNPNDYL